MNFNEKQIPQSLAVITSPQFMEFWVPLDGYFIFNIGLNIKPKLFFSLTLPS